MKRIINGIQQIGIGVADAKEVFNWYRKHLDFDILVFEDEADASLMTQYTAGVVRKRYAILALNMLGGGGLEIWQFKDRTPQPPKNPIRIGDLGINAIKVRSGRIDETHSKLQALNLNYLTPIAQNGYFNFIDPWGNWVQVIAEDYTYFQCKSSSGGVLGAIIGVSNIEESLVFYQNLLGYDIVVSDEIGHFEEFFDLHLGGRLRRIVLKPSAHPIGGFGELYGPSQIELVQALDRNATRIYENRLWGDLGYIHICFDVYGFDVLRKEAQALGYVFTVDSTNSFDMGEAAGRFGYIEDPDGTLIEIVETHKVPIFKRLGLYINLRKRNSSKPLPKWLVGLLSIHRVKRDL